MSKAVLVIDTPEYCGQCPFYDALFEMCRHKFKDIDNAKIRPIWCPLKPLPEEDNKEEYFNEWSRGYQAGWNDCIDAILRGEQNE